uniref:Ig-like domain-containing protein n=1 Tax=Coturnix japonica TaxID=93934 RepID=A0A8C2U0T3_COTJA
FCIAAQLRGRKCFVGFPQCYLELERIAHEGTLPAVAIDQKEKQKPELVLVPEPARVLEGETARFRCRVTGYPLPKVNWYLNSQLIRKSKRFRLRYDGIHYLDIVDCKSYDTDSAVYTCEAKNDYGVATTSASLSVESEFSGGWSGEENTS